MSNLYCLFYFYFFSDSFKSFNSSQDFEFLLKFITVLSVYHKFLLQQLTHDDDRKLPPGHRCTHPHRRL